MIDGIRFKLLLAIVLMGLLVFLANRVQQYQRAQNGLQKILQQGVLRVGLDASFPPFESLDANGDVVGLDADIARAIAADLGVTAQFVNIGFDGLYDALTVGKVDIILSGLPVDSYRTRDVAYSVNYFNAGQVLATTRPDLTTIDDLAGQTVAVEWGSLGDLAARQLAQTIPTISIAAQPDAAAALRYDTVIVDAVTVLSSPHHHVVAYLSDSWYAAAVAITNQALLKQVNSTLTRLQQTAQPPCNLAIPPTTFVHSPQVENCYR